MKFLKQVYELNFLFTISIKKKYSFFIWYKIYYKVSSISYINRISGFDISRKYFRSFLSSSLYPHEVVYLLSKLSRRMDTIELQNFVSRTKDKNCFLRLVSEICSNVSASQRRSLKGSKYLSFSFSIFAIPFVKHIRR